MLSRQTLPMFDRNRYAPAAGLARGAYVMADAEKGEPQVILIASGSEVQLCIEAYEGLKQENIAVRVVSMPSWELFERQDERVSQDRAAASHQGAGRGRNGRRDRLGSLRRRNRRDHRHAQLWRLSANQGFDAEIRLCPE